MFSFIYIKLLWFEGSGTTATLFRLLLEEREQQGLGADESSESHPPADIFQRESDSYCLSCFDRIIPALLSGPSAPLASGG